jgi:hypothetical protein
MVVLALRKALERAEESPNVVCNNKNSQKPTQDTTKSVSTQDLPQNMQCKLFVLPPVSEMMLRSRENLDIRSIVFIGSIIPSVSMNFLSFSRTG